MPALELISIDAVVLAVAAFVAGGINAIAGGGSFLTLAALVWTGVPPVVANATGTVAQVPGYIASAWALRRELAPPPGITMVHLLLLSLLGGAAGAALLLLTPARAFDHLVPWLLLLATALFAFAPQLRRWAEKSAPQQPTQIQHTTQQASSSAASTTTRASAAAAVLGVGVYGGYFNGGLGIVLLALFALLGQRSLLAMNGLKALASALLAGVAVVVYAVGGIVAWPQALLMAAAATAGGWVGALAGRHLPAPVLRWSVVITGLMLAFIFFMRVKN